MLGIQCEYRSRLMVMLAYPKKVLDQFRVDATPEQQSSACVPEIVPANRGEACSLEERLEVAVDYVLGVLADDQPEGGCGSSSR
jgi:hypothetical protein